MRAAQFLRFAAAIFCFMVITTGIMAQKPAPINNETINMLLGTWEAEPYEMFGTKRSETISYSLDMNGQFMLINVDGKDETGFTYKALVVVQVNPDGTLNGWSFDDWGKVGTYVGTTSGNTMTVNGTKEGNNDSRVMEVTGNKMTTKVTFNFKDKEGKQISESKTITLNKK